MEGSNPGKVVQKQPCSPRVRVALAPGPTLPQGRNHRSPITNSVLSQASHRIIIISAHFSARSLISAGTSPGLRSPNPTSLASLPAICLLVACLLVVVVVACDACPPGEVAHFGKKGGWERGQKWDSSDERSRVGKIAHLSRGPFFFDAEFRVWRGRIPEKWSKNGPFPLGGDCL